jgi:hypothetical protein
MPGAPGRSPLRPHATVLQYRQQPMTDPQFSSVDNDLWQWREWFIALANGAFWLLTPTPREFGPFDSFDEAIGKAEELWS